MDDELIQAMLRDDQALAARIAALEAGVLDLWRFVGRLEGQHDLDVARIAELERQIKDS